MKTRMDPAGPFWVIVCACLWATACAQREPAATVLVEDRAGLLSEDEEASVAGWHAALLDQHDIDYRVLTVAGPTDLAALQPLTGCCARKSASRALLPRYRRISR